MGSFNITHHSSTSKLPERCYLVLTYTPQISKTRLKLCTQQGLLVLFFRYYRESMATTAVWMGSSGRNTEVPPFPAENEFSPTARTSDVNTYFHLFSLFLSAYGIQ